MLIEQCIADLIHNFSEAPMQFFQERELHASFFGLCRNRFPLECTCDGHKVHLFRHEYETIFKHARKDPAPFTERLIDRGKAACFDFAILNQEFVKNGKLLDVINKDDSLRKNQHAKLPKNGVSGVIDAAIEFKMAHRRHQHDIAQGQVNALKRGMLLDARKLATERIKAGYLLAFSHGPLPESAESGEILRSVLKEHAMCRNDVEAVQIRALLATPQNTFLIGGWSNPETFPHSAII